MTRIDSRLRRLRLLAAGAAGCLMLVTLACDAGGPAGHADTGGIGGTGISQGTVTAFGSIFVNGVEWNVDQATVDLGAGVATPSDLKLGMQVRVVGDFAEDRRSGVASSIKYEPNLEGPIEGDPVITAPGATTKSFSVLHRTVFVDEAKTVFAGGASYAGLARDQVLEVSGFENFDLSVRATRVELRGIFPVDSEVEFCGVVANLDKHLDGSGIFEIEGVTVRYSASTEFPALTREALVNGIMVDVEGVLRASGSEIDADEIEEDEDGLDQSEAEVVELAGFVMDFVSLGDFSVSEIPIDASAAVLEPSGLVVGNGTLVEIHGRLVGGRLIADRIEAEDGTEGAASIEAAVTSVDAVRRELSILGVTVAADGNTAIQDERDGDEHFEFGEIMPGDWLKIEGAEVGAARIVAEQIVRDVGSDVILRGSVTALDRDLPAMSVLSQSIPLNSGTAYEDAFGQSRSEEEFFRTPGDVEIGDVVQVVDESAVDPLSLLDADEVEWAD